MKYNKLQHILLLVSLIVFGAKVSAQSDLSSPYSRFGIGDISTGSPNTILKGMGGIFNSISDHSLLNPNNPASYGAIDSLSFLFDAGFYIKTASYSTSNMTENGSNASFDYASVGFSAAKWWKMGLGIMPYSNREYNDITSHNDLGRYNVDFEGEGGLSRVFFTNAFKITKNLSVGVTASYIFGTLSDLTTIYYPDSTYYINGKRSIDMRISDFKFDYGILYSIPIKDSKVNIGLTYSQGSNINSKRDVFIRSMFKGYNNLVENPIDTLKYVTDENVSITIPQGFGIGVSYEKNNRWMIGADFNWNGWKGFEFNGANDSLQNAWNIAVGGEYRPKANSISKYYKRIAYRAGFHYDQTYYNINGNSIDKFGITFGLGLPVPRSLTSFNIAIEIGKMGTISNNLVRENYFNISIGMSIYDRWFVKRKYK